MSKDTASVEPTNGYFAGGSRRAADLVRQMPATRPAKVTTGRARISAAKSSKKARAQAMGPTPERLAKGDVATPRTVGGFHRSLSMTEQLRDKRHLQKPTSRLSPPALEQLHKTGKLDYDAHTAEAMYQAGEKLQRHYEGMGGSVQAQDLNKIMGSAGGDLSKEEAWVFHRDAFRTAIKLIGWSDTNPHRGAGRIVVAVVCEGMTIREAASAHLPAARVDAMQVTAIG